jgi:hypothetical protein
MTARDGSLTESGQIQSGDRRDASLANEPQVLVDRFVGRHLRFGGLMHHIPN